ncbi:hypothetical protein ACWPM1_12470 [Tsuneonella sp. HG249]
MRRAVLPAALLLLAGCGIDSDPANDKVTVTYDEDRIEKAGRAAKQVATGAANVAGTTGRAIKKEVGDIDVDVRVSRTKGEETPTER